MNLTTALVATDAAHRTCFATLATTHLVVDAMGWFVATPDLEDVLA